LLTWQTFGPLGCWQSVCFDYPFAVEPALLANKLLPAILFVGEPAVAAWRTGVVSELAVSLAVVANRMLFAIRLHWRTCCMLRLDHYSCTPLSPSLVSLHYKIQTTDYYQTSNSCFTQQSGKYFK